MVGKAVFRIDVDHQEVVLMCGCDDKWYDVNIDKHVEADLEGQRIGDKVVIIESILAQIMKRNRKRRHRTNWRAAIEAWNEILSLAKAHPNASMIWV